MVFQHPENLLRNLVHRSVAVNWDQPARPLIVLNHGTSLLLIRREPWLNYFQPVVIAGHQLCRVGLIAQFIHAGRL